jgi:hydroxymethylbilane synthase
VSGPRVLRVATRGSPLALHQAESVCERLKSLAGAGPCETVVIRTTGDRLSEVPIDKIGGQGAFAADVSRALVDGRADIAVHSAKDLPSELEPGSVLAAVPERADPRDALVGSRLGDLPAGATIATGSVRRRAQLAWLRPDLTFCELRGNIHTRIGRAEKVGAGVLAMAALERLGLADRAAEVLSPKTLLPQVGQGAIAVECRESDAQVFEMLAEIDDRPAHVCVSAERAFLGTLGSGCTLPCGALASYDGARDEADEKERALVLEAMIASRDGHVLVRRSSCGEEPRRLGRDLAVELLESCGGAFLVDWGADAVRRP